MSDTSSSRRPREGGAAPKAKKRTANGKGNWAFNGENSGARQTTSLFGGFLSKIHGLIWPQENEGSLRDTIEELIDEQEGGEEEIDEDERILLANILNLHDITVCDVMVPRADIVAVEIGTPLPELIKLMSAKGHSRMPVFRENLDDVCGMVHIKDVLAWTGSPKGNFHIAKIARQALFVAPSMRVLDLLLEMRLTRIHMAMVVDEFGGVDGLVTIEDLVEEIVGEIEDEHDPQEAPLLVERSDGTFVASARASVEEFESRVGSFLTDEERAEDIETLGGLVFLLADRVPGRGEVICHSSGHEFEILDADPRRIKRLRIRVATPASEQVSPKEASTNGSFAAEPAAKRRAAGETSPKRRSTVASLGNGASQIGDSKKRSGAE